MGQHTCVRLTTYVCVCLRARDLVQTAAKLLHVPLHLLEAALCRRNIKATAEDVYDVAVSRVQVSQKSLACLRVSHLQPPGQPSPPSRLPLVLPLAHFSRLLHAALVNVAHEQKTNNADLGASSR